MDIPFPLEIGDMTVDRDLLQHGQKPLDTHGGEIEGLTGGTEQWMNAIMMIQN